MTSGELTLGLAIGLHNAPARDYLDEARRAADAGFDIVEVPDHLGMVAPLPILAAIVTAVPGVQVTNFVLNTAFYRPHLLARDAAAVHQLSGGRFILSLGTGYVEAEFVAAGLPFPTAGERVRLVRDMIVAAREIFADPQYIAPTPLPPPPVLVAGSGDRLLAVAAQHADIVLIDPIVTEAELAERIDYVRAQAGDRAEELTFGTSFTDIWLDGSEDLQRLRGYKPGASDDELRALVTALTGSLDDALARIERVRALGVRHLVFARFPHVGWDVMERLVTAVRAA